GAAGDQRYTYLVRRTRVGVSRMHGSLFVANQNMLEFVLFVDCVVDVQYRAARVAKYMVYAFFGKATHDDIGAIEFHNGIPFVTSTCALIDQHGPSLNRLQQHDLALYDSRSHATQTPC